jgi:hypothetical protein
MLGRDESHKASLIRHMERIEPEKFAGRGDFRGHLDRLFVDRNRESRGLGDLDQGAGQSAAGQIAQAMNSNASLEQFEHRCGKWRSTAFDRGFKGEPLTRRHHRDSMAADISAQDDGIARAHAGGLDRNGRNNAADTRRVDEHTIGLAALDDLGITSDKPNPGSRRGLTHRHSDPAQGRNRQPLLQNEADAEIERPRRTSPGH